MALPVYACICAAVTTSQVEATILAGARTVSDIGERCYAGTGCGNCVKRLQRLIDQTELSTERMEKLPRSA